MKQVKVRDLLRLLSLLVMVSTYLPIVFVNLPPIVKSHHLYTTLWFITLIFLRPDIFKDSLFLFCLLQGVFIYLLVLFFYSEVSGEFTEPLLEEFYSIIVSVSIYRYYIISEDLSGLATLVKRTFYCIIITAILSIITSIINPMYARDLIGISELVGKDLESVLAYKKFGGGQYDFFSGIICLFPILIYYYQNSNLSIWRKKHLVVFIIILFFCLVRVQIFANILISVVVILLCLVGSVNRKRSLIAIFIFVFGLSLIPIQYYSTLFLFFSDQFSTDSDLHIKLRDLGAYLVTGGVDTEAGSRAQRFPMLMKIFLSNPICGGGEGNHHMYWMNKLAVFGILGTLPFVMFVMKFVRASANRFRKEFVYFFVLSIMAIIALGFMKALVGRNLWYTFFLLVPGCYYLPLLRSKHDFS